MMPPSGWVTHIYLPLITVTAVLGLVFGVLAPPSQRIGHLHLAALAFGALGLPPMLMLARRRLSHVPQRLERLGNLLARREKALLLGLVIAAFGFYTTLGAVSSAWQPVLHDEFSYLFGAQTLALGRLFNPPHPHRDFFDAIHILHEDKWLTRYPPGHPLALLPGVLLGWPALGPIALCAATVFCTYGLARDRLGAGGGLVAGWLALQAPALAQVSGGFLSTSTFWLTLAGFYVCLFRAAGTANEGAAAQEAGTRSLQAHTRTADKRPLACQPLGKPIAWAVAAGSLAGWMFLTRPFAAVAAGWPGAAWLLLCCTRHLPSPLRGSRNQASQGLANKALLAAQPRSQASIGRRRGGLILLAAGLPFLLAVALFLTYNLLITGDPFYTPWAQYRDRYEPANALGFSDGGPQPLPTGVHERKRQKAAAMAHDKQAFTPAEALRRALLDPKRATDTLFPATCFFGLIGLWAFLGRGRQWQRTDTVLLLVILSHYAAYSFFHAARDVGYYAFEVTPLVVYFTAAGAVGLWRQAQKLGYPALALIVPGLIALALANRLLVEGPGFVRIRQQETACPRDFLRMLANRPDPDQPALVFVRYGPTHLLDRYDWINNPPNPDAAPVLVVLDLGSRNRKLIAYYLDRRCFLYDEATDTLTSISDNNLRQR